MAESTSLKRLNPAVRPLRYVINMAVDPDKAEFSGTVEIEIECDSTQTAIELHALGFTFDSINWLKPQTGPKSGKAVPSAPGMISVSFGEALPRGTHHLRFGYRGEFAKGLEGLYRARNGLTWGAFTQFQAIGARRVFPCFDEPAYKAIFALTLRVPDNFEAVSNELEIDRIDQDGTRTIRFAPTPPLPTYLLGFAVGEFDIVPYDPVPAGEVARDPIPLRGLARRGQGKNLIPALQWTASILQAMEAWFGTAYPFTKLDCLAVPDFAAGGMENAGMVTYAEELILLDADSSFEQYRDAFTTHAHEIAHHWVGNLVSPAWWDDLWLNESFATFMEAKISHQLRPTWGYDSDLQKNAVDAMALDLLPSVSRIHRVVATQDEITTAFDAITYQKGAVALAMLEDEMGEAAFRTSVQKLLNENRFRTYDTGKFFGIFHVRSNARNANSSIARLINQKGIPIRAEPGFLLQPHAAASYFRARLAPAQWQKVFEEAKKLGRMEGLRAVISLDLALQNREVSLNQYLDGVRAFAGHTSWEVAGFALERLGFLISELPDPTPVKELASRLYGPMLRDMGAAPLAHDTNFNDWQVITKRGELAEFFSSSDADPLIELDLLFHGLRLLETPDDVFDSEWLPEEMKQSALTAVIHTRQDNFADRILMLLRQTDTSWQRDILLDVLAADTSPGSDGRLREIFEEDDIKAEEIGEFLAGRASNPKLREDLLRFLEGSAPLLLERLDGDADIGIIQCANAFTSEAHARRLEAIMRPILSTIQGGEPQLALTLERIALNARMLEHVSHKT